jgi:hypothetical protein
VLTRPWVSSELLKTLSLLAVATNTLQRLHVEKSLDGATKAVFLLDLQIVTNVWCLEIVEKTFEIKTLLTSDIKSWWQVFIWLICIWEKKRQILLPWHIPNKHHVSFIVFIN